MGGADDDRIAASPIRDLYESPEWIEALEALRQAAPATPKDALFASAYAQRAAPVTMLIEEVEAIWAAIAERDDWSLFENKIEEIRAAAPWLSGQVGAT